MVNINKIKGEMILHNISETDLMGYGIPSIRTMIENKTIPISLLTKIAKILDVSNDYLMDGLNANNYRRFTPKYTIDYKKIKNQEIKLGWQSQILNSLVSDYENSYRTICYGKLNKLYGYEINNICYLLELNSSDVFKNVNIECNTYLNSIQANFKVNSNIIKEKCSNNLKDFCSNIGISTNYAKYLMKNNVNTSTLVAKRIAKYLNINIEDLEYNSGIKYINDNNDSTKFISNNDEKESKKILEQKPNIDVEKISKRIKSQELIQLAIDDPQVFELFKELVILNEKDKKCIIDILSTLMKNFK